MGQFRVELDGLELSDEQTKRISSGVQQLVLKELASIDFKGDAHVFIRDPEWYGIWARHIHREDIGRLDERIIEQFGRKF